MHSNHHHSRGTLDQIGIGPFAAVLSSGRAWTDRRYVLRVASCILVHFHNTNTRPGGDGEQLCRAKHCGESYKWGRGASSPARPRFCQSCLRRLQGRVGAHCRVDATRRRSVRRHGVRSHDVVIEELLLDPVCCHGLRSPVEVVRRPHDVYCCGCGDLALAPEVGAAPDTDELQSGRRRH